MKLQIYQSKTLIRCSVATTILNRLYIGVPCQMGTACACEVYERSLSLLFASFRRNPPVSLPGLHKFQLGGVWESRVEGGEV